MHALTYRARGENLWGHTPEQDSTACEKSVPLSTSPVTPQKAFLCAPGDSSASQGPAVERRALSLPQAFPCPHSQVSQGWQFPQHSKAQCVGTCLAAPGTSTRPQEPSSAPTSQTKRRTLVVYGRDPFRECFAKFL